MSIQDSLLVSLFGISTVFFVLIALSFLVKLQSLVIGNIVKKQESMASPDKNVCTDVNSNEVYTGNSNLSTGELKLIGVDERTAAMIMAIVSDESQIPLSELQFKSIKKLDN